MIIVRDLWQKFYMGNEEVVAVKQVSLDVARGEFVSLTGPSGSGKSTLLHLIGGLCRPERGEVTVNGESLNRMSENQLAVFRRHHIGFIFQTFNLMPGLTALENVTLPLVFAEISPCERRRRAEKMLQMVGLSHRLEHKPSELSGGQRRIEDVSSG